MVIRTVLFDLDGVIRHFSVRDVAAIEQRHCLANGALGQAAFAQPRLTAVTTGQITRDEWVRAIGEQIGDTRAAAEWSRLIPSVDADMLNLADELRSRDLTTAVLTNGTNTIAAEVAASGIDRHFDHIFNSADIGYAKPDTRVFKHALAILRCRPSEVFFTDDTASNIEGARTLDLITHLFTGIDDLRKTLTRKGIEI